MTERDAHFHAQLTDGPHRFENGLELLRSLRGSSKWHDVPVVMITTEGGQARVQEAIELGATSYVRKPFSADLLRDKLAALLSK